MKILLISFVVPTAPSGVRYSYTQLAQVLRAQGHSVDIVTPQSSSKIVNYPLGAISRVISLFGSKGKFISSEISNFFKILSVLRSKNDYDIVNAQDIGSAYVASVAFGSRIPVVLTCRFNDDPATEVILRNEWTGYFARIVTKWKAHQFSKIKYYTGVSDYVINKSRKFFPKDSLVKKVFNSMDFENISQQKVSEEFQRRFQGKKVIINVGYLEKRKNQRYLIGLTQELIKRRTDFIIAIVGEGEDYEYLKNKIDENNLHEHVILTGPVKEIFSLLKTANLYLHTALNESFGRVLVEAIACKIPVMGFAVGGIPEILHDEALINPNISHSLLSERLNEILDSHNFLNDLQRKQYEVAVEKFEIQNMARNYSSFYEEVVAEFKGIKKIEEPSFGEVKYLA